ncbi:hypothetical protein BDV95DRAFT_607134 [Massariosphaeria phaeospora]|uniref:Thioredoxin domain-containing protein n=1 Tax=Massariosphaeria phaeospora TaxID=100035 RepID=A0A7C8M656_9PLEO|nr:hypothetical protein BDV95DRAFT_607134 [Massariosphaeria phaeospora]
MGPKKRGRKRSAKPSADEPPTKKANTGNGDPTSNPSQSETKNAPQRKDKKVSPPQKVIQWILPRQTSPGDDDATFQFASRLLDCRLSRRVWDKDTKSRAKTLDPSPIWSPVLASTGANRKAAIRNVNRGSQDLARTFQQHVGATGNPSQNSRALFGATGETAVVASRSDDHPVITLSGSWRITITPSDGEPQTFDIVRVRGESEEHHRYWIRVPNNTNLIVNGQTFQYDNSKANKTKKEQVRELWIGSLDDFTVIELLGQPIFFWRRRDDLSYRPQEQGAPGAEPADGHGDDVQDDDLTVVWEEIDDLQYQDERQQAAEQQAADQQAADQQAADQQAVDQQDEVQSEIPAGSVPPKQGPSNQVAAPLVPSQQNPIQQDPVIPAEVHAHGNANQKLIDPALNHDAIPTPVKKRSSSSSNRSKSPQSPTDGDIFEGSTPCAYLKKRLEELEDEFVDSSESHVGKPLPDLLLGALNTVICAINGRQNPESGFCLLEYGSLPDTAESHTNRVPKRVVRAGRPLLLPMLHNEHMVLLVVQPDEDYTATVHVLDSRQWIFSKSDRDTVYQSALTVLRKTHWWRSITDDDEETQEPFTQSATWVAAAQKGDEEGSQFYAILSAWALAMRLELNVTFKPKIEEQFITEARKLIHLAIDHRSLDWKLLLAFFRCHGFITNKVRSPPQNRRFRHGPNFSIADDAERAARWDSQHVLFDFSRQLRVQLPAGRTHTGNFQSDRWDDNYKQEVVPDLIRTNPNTSLGELDTRFDQDVDIPEDFDACAYLRDNIPAQPIIAENVQKSDEDKFGLDRDVIFQAIAGVNQAITSFQPPRQGLAAIDLATLRSTVLPNVPNESADASVFGEGRLLLFPWSWQQHTVLVAVQVEPTEDADEPGGPKDLIKIYVLDSAPWIANQKERRITHLKSSKLIQSNGWNSGLEASLPEFTMWTNRVLNGENRYWQSGYYTIFNAWSVLLGLQPRSAFRPTGDFWLEAKTVVETVLDGTADWKLIWSFLRCHGFVAEERPPNPDRRFRRAINDKRLDSHLAYLRARRQWRSQQPDMPFHNNWKFPTGQPHSNEFASDNWDETDRTERVPTLYQGRRLRASLPASQLREWYVRLQRQPAQIDTTDIPAAVDDPCGYLRKRLAEISEDSHKQNLLAGIHVAMGMGQWLEEVDVDMAIASVTLAITRGQYATPTNSLGPVRAMSFLPALEKQLCGMISDFFPEYAAIRPGRPMIVPLIPGSRKLNEDQNERLSSHIGTHIILLVMRFDRDGLPAISVLDSMPWVLEDDTRDLVFGIAWNILRSSGWWRETHRTIDDFERDKPATATWSRCAVQVNDWLCGFLVILNAWSLALGLTVNPDFKADLSGNFLEELQMIVQLARAGLADWSLIYAFLRCHDFVTSDVVPSPARITNTLRIQDEEELKDHLKEIKVEEAESHGKKLSRIMIYANNLLRVPDGRKHNSTFPSDSWTEDTKNRVRELQEWGIDIDINRSAAQVDQDWDRHINSNLDEASDVVARIERRLQQHTGLSLQDSSLENIASDFHKYYLPDSSTGQELHEAMALVDACKYWFKKNKQLQQVQKLMSGKLKGTKSKELPKLGGFLEDEDIVAAISSVVGAIDSIQPLSNGRHAGGYTLSTSSWISMARTGHQDTAVRVARSRRCWFMPFCVDGELNVEVKNIREENKGGKNTGKSAGEQHKHTFLVVLQEEKDKSEFRTYILDPAPEHYADVRPFLLAKIEEAARNLGWHSNRNDQDQIGFSKVWRNVKVPRHGAKYGCGYHAIVNAWILALGLHPNHELEKMTEQIYKEIKNLAELACQGLLDWLTLFAFLKCRNLIAIPERSGPKIVKKHFRFHSTLIQLADSENTIGENTLGDRIKKMAAQDDELAQDSIDKTPYDRTLNVHFSKKTEGGREDSPSAADAPTLAKFAEHLGEDPGKVPNLAERFNMYLNKTLPTLNEDDKNGHCRYFKARYGLLQEIMEEMERRIDPVTKLPTWERLQRGDTVAFLTRDNVMAGIASVVRPLHERQLTSGYSNAGFAIAQGSDIAWGCRGGIHRDVDFVVSRPRRCWFMPVKIIDKIPRTLLVVIQEEEEYEGDPDTHVFRAYVLDSLEELSELSQRVRESLYPAVQRAAENLGWTSGHRFRGEFVEFETIYRGVKVARQVNNLHSALHTIVNAWILALGLTPNPTANFGATGLYPELYQMIRLALNGLVDWQLLVAWLICRGLVEETSLEYVLADRRFYQSLAPDLSDFIPADVAAEHDLARDDGSHYKMDRNTNVDFSTMLTTDYKVENIVMEEDEFRQLEEDRRALGLEVPQEEEEGTGNVAVQAPDDFEAILQRVLAESKILKRGDDYDEWDISGRDEWMMDSDEVDSDHDSLAFLDDYDTDPHRTLFGASLERSNQNRVFDNIRTPQDLHTLTMVSAAGNRPLITLWSASWCTTCQAVKPIVKALIEDEKVGEQEGGLGFAEVELDSVLIGDLGVKYMIMSMPTLLAFSRQEAQTETKLTKPEQMKNKEFLREWLLMEARRGGRAGGAGGSLLGDLLGRS